MSTKLILLRHAESAGNARGLSDGRIDVPLSEKGKHQALALIPKLKSLNPDIIFASPLKRVIQTIQPYVNQKKEKIIINKLIIERACGSFDGKREGAIRKYCQARNLNRLTFGPEGGESILQVHSRAIRFLKYLKSKKEFKNKTILIASHRNFLMALELAIRNIPIKDFYNFKRLGNANLRVLKIN